jgi:radical SAM protein with 4Fe4S-binding SPASM domain
MSPNNCAIDLTDSATHLDRLYALAAETWIPIGVMIEVNHACHLSCVHCYIGKDPQERPLTTDELRRVLDEIAAEGTLFLTISGGEIFLRKDLLEILGHARRLGFILTLFTTATLITPEVADRVAALYPLAIEISLYSIRPEIHEAVTRRPGSHARTMEGVKLLRERGVPVTLKAPIMTLNDGEQVGVKAFADSLGADSRFDVTISPRRDGDTIPMNYQLAAERVSQLGRDPILGRAAGPREARPPGATPCGAGRWGCDISPSGDVYPCLAFPYGLSAGSLRQQSFHEIWHSSPMMRRIRELTLGDLGRASGGCGHGGGECTRCMGFTLTLHGSDALGLPSRE